jgi:hypothetical protein
VLEPREFRGVCYGIARRTGGRVVDFWMADGDVTPNYNQGIIDYGDRRLAIVCTRDRMVPFLAVAEPKGLGEWGSLTFVDAPEIVAILAELPDVRVFTKAELAVPLDIKLWPDVSPHDVKYWRPDSLGDALFNDWD